MGESGYKDNPREGAMLPAAYLLDKNDKVIERMGGIPHMPLLGLAARFSAQGLFVVNAVAVPSQEIAPAAN